MKRKTNIFYNYGDDSNFLTFSNYTEALTGNFVSTNTKLYPSKFLCLYSPKLFNETDNGKVELINNVLCGQYENKLAFLRDKLIEKNKGEHKNTYSIEAELSSLSYLLEYLQEWDNDIKIVYVGEISEQDFNGTYTDTICVVDSLYYKSVEEGWPELDKTLPTEYFPYIEIRNSDDEIEVEAEDNKLSEYLYGWYYIDADNEVQKIFDSDEIDIKPGFSELELCNGYNKNSVYRNLKLYDVVSPKDDLENKRELGDLTFNIIIPLFDLINNDYKANLDTLSDIDEINLLADGKADENGVYNAPYISNVPLGIWFSPMFETTLKRDYDKGYAQSWSLVIGSQFKPFPYMNYTPNEIKRDSIAGAYMTFAEALSGQNDLGEKLNNILNSLNDISKRLTKIENTVNNCPGYNDNNMNNLRLEFLGYKDEVNQIINNMQTQLNNTKLRWVNREG